jgi:hypothetical protein
MSTARFHPRLSLCLLFTALLISASPGQGQATISIMIDPPEATVHIGETQSFMALVNGAVNAAIQWAVQEGDGGSITKEGVYTAPKDIGIYHVIAIATSDGAALAQAVAKVTVVTHYDTSPNLPTLY